MKNQALFSSKDKSKKLKCRLLQFLFGAFRVKQSSSGDFFFILFRRNLLSLRPVTWHIHHLQTHEQTSGYLKEVNHLCSFTVFCNIIHVHVAKILT